MKKAILSAAAILAVGVTSASAADLATKVYTKAPPAVAFDPWDIAFGAAHHQRLHLPRHHPVQPQAVGHRLFRAALQRHQGLAALCRRRRSRASRSRTAPRLKSTSTAVSARPSARSPSTSASGATCIRAEPANTARQRRRHSPALLLSVECAANASGQRQRSQEGRQLLRSLRQGELHLQRHTSRWAATSTIRRTS